MPILFLHKADILFLHDRLIAGFGGHSGIRDGAALESAIAAPINRMLYEAASLETCAATYAYHLSHAHAFIDGNKRVAAAATELFLELNAARLVATDETLIGLFLRIAAGELTREAVENIISASVVCEA